ncbi:hypothetical protein IMZ48_02745 [Candidatus Bathyarchaeota archaeon]|nr:hypothetical protein [Candidatus Bathyarchaeota archaeon]
MASITKCIPIEAAWNERIVDKKCLEGPAYMANSMINILTDFAICSLPRPIIVKLRMHWRQKAGLLVVSTLGYL